MLTRRKVTQWRLRTRSLQLGVRTLVMGVVNITADSFSDGGAFLDPEAAVARCMQCIEQGADLLDLGAESTRPGSRAGGEDAAVSTEEEQARLLPVLRSILQARPDSVISIDTYKAATARGALEAGAEIINDVSGFTWDEQMPRVCAEWRAGAILMHSRGRPDEWLGQNRLHPAEVLATVRGNLASSLAAARRAGLPTESIVLDPGYGFGKRFEENYVLLARQSELLAMGRPLLAGVSRKSFLGHTLAEFHGGSPAPIDARETATIAALVTSILHGASIVRVHNVRPAVEAARIADAILGSA